MRKLSDEPVILLLTKELHAQSNEIDQDMLATDCSPIHHTLLGLGRFKPCLRSGYFL